MYSPILATCFNFRVWDRSKVSTLQELAGGGGQSVLIRCDGFQEEEEEKYKHDLKFITIICTNL